MADKNMVPSPEPVTVMLVEPVLGWLPDVAFPVKITSSRSIDIDSVTVPSLLPRVAKLRVEVCRALEAIQRMHVCDVHSVASQLVPAKRPPCDRAAMPKPLPYTVTDIDPVFALLSRRLLLTKPESKDKACDNEPDEDPMVAMTP